MKIETSAGAFKATAFTDGHPVFIDVFLREVNVRMLYDDLPDLIYTLTRIQEKIKKVKND